MKKKMISLLLVLALVVGICPAAFAMETAIDTYAESIVLVENEEGIYEIASSNIRGGFRVTAKEGGQVYVQDTNNQFMRIDDSRFMKAQELFVDIENYRQFQNVAEAKGLSNQLQSDVDKIMTKVLNGEIELAEPLSVYIPEEIDTANGSRSISKTTKTYTGYAGRQYYQELLDCKGNSLEFNVKKPATAFEQYVEHFFRAGATAAIDGVMTKIVGPGWTLARVLLFAPSDSIPTTYAYKHTAKLFENKYTKYTYLVQVGEYYFGSKIDYTYKYFFRNFINEDGKAFYSNGDTENCVAKAPGYDQADEYAYKRWASQPYESIIANYTYTNEDANVTTSVDSLFQ